MSGICPICGKTAAPRAENPSTPFCGARCKQIDLGKWLREEYRIPTNETSHAEAQRRNEVSTWNEPSDEPSNARELAAGNRKEPPS